MSCITSRNVDDLLAATELRRALQAEAKDRLIAAQAEALQLWLTYYLAAKQHKCPDDVRKLRLVAQRATVKVLA